MNTTYKLAVYSGLNPANSLYLFAETHRYRKAVSWSLPSFSLYFFDNFFLIGDFEYVWSIDDNTDRTSDSDHQEYIEKKSVDNTGHIFPVITYLQKQPITRDNYKLKKMSTLNQSRF